MVRVSEYPADIELGLIRAKEAHLRAEFLRHATVKDFEKGYISVPFVNQLIDLELQGFAADMIAQYASFLGQPIDKIVQIPYSGNSLATSVAERLRLPLVPGRKGKALPGTWNHPIVIEEGVASFTTGEKSTFVFNGLEKGDRVYLVDDVVAHGYTAGLLTKKFNERDISVVGIGIYFAKLFQPGIKHIQTETSIQPFYAIGIERITKEEGIILAPPRF